MSDFYTEQLIKKRATAKDMMIKIGLLALTVLSVLILFIFPMGIIAPVVMIAKRCLCFPETGFGI